MPLARPPKYCACMAHGVKLIRSTTLSAASAGSPPNRAAADATTSPTVNPILAIIRIGTSITLSGMPASDLRRGVTAFALPGNHPLDPSHQAEERRADDRQHDDGGERSR